MIHLVSKRSNYGNQILYQIYGKIVDISDEQKFASGVSHITVWVQRDDEGTDVDSITILDSNWFFHVFEQERFQNKKDDLVGWYISATNLKVNVEPDADYMSYSFLATHQSKFELEPLSTCKVCKKNIFTPKGELFHRNCLNRNDSDTDDEAENRLLRRYRELKIFSEDLKNEEEFFDIDRHMIDACRYYNLKR